MDDIRALKPMYQLDPAASWAALGLLLLAGAAWLGWRFIWSRPAAAPVGLAPGDEVPSLGWTALDWLDDLALRGWIEQGRDREFHVQLAAILRAHLQAAWAVPADRLTTPEAVRALAPCVEAGVADVFASLLHACDAVKFSPVRPGGEAMNERLQATRTLLQGRVAPVITPEGAGVPGGTP